MRRIKWVDNEDMAHYAEVKNQDGPWLYVQWDDYDELEWVHEAHVSEMEA